MVVSEGYTIEQYPNRNLITISLPQTESTMQSTYTPLVQRKKKLTDAELSAILMVVKQMYSNNT